MRPATGPERAVKPSAFSYFLLHGEHVGRARPSSALIGCSASSPQRLALVITAAAILDCSRHANQNAGSGESKCLILRDRRFESPDRKSTRLKSSHRCISYAV